MSSFFDILSTIEYISFVSGLFINAFLLYCILWRTQHDLGAYKYMQVIYVSIDVSYAVAQILIAERFISQDLVLMIFGLSPVGNSRIMICAFLALYAITYLMIDYNFLYRLWTLKSPERVRLFSEKWFVLLLVLIAVIFYIVWGSMCFVFFVPSDHGRLKLRELAMYKYGVDTMTQGMIMGDYFHEDGTRNLFLLIGVLLLFTILAFCSSFMIYAATSIVYYLKTSKMISEKGMQLQRQLFILLCAQTLVPLLILYSPCLFNVGFPNFSLDAEWFADMTPLSLSFFLPIDGLAILYFMKDYRRAVIDFITCRRCIGVKVTRESSVTAIGMRTL